MMKGKVLAMLAISTVLLGSCVKNEYHTDPEPSTNNTGGSTTGSKVFNDQFDKDEHSWSFSDPADSAYVSIINGTLKYSYLKTTGSSSVSVNTGISFRSNFSIKTRIKSNHIMGIIFGASNTAKGYSFLVDDKGYFAVYNEGDSTTSAQAILSWQYAPAIITGDWNDIRFEQSGDYWNGYINNTKVFQVQSQYLPTGKAGFIVLANTAGTADYLTVQ
jgi:hypothetical protein